MSTYFLISSKSKSVKEPKDEFIDCPFTGHSAESQREADSCTKIKSSCSEPNTNNRRTSENGFSDSQNLNSRTVDHINIKVKSSTCSII